MLVLVKNVIASVWVMSILCHFSFAQSADAPLKNNVSVIDSVVSSLKNVKQKINNIFRHEPLRRQPADILKDNAHVSDAMVKRYAEKRSFKPEWNANLSESVSHIMHIKIPFSPYENMAQNNVIDNQHFNIVNSHTFSVSKKIK